VSAVGMNRKLFVFIGLLLPILALLPACATDAKPAVPGEKTTIAVTYSILGSVVKELVGDAANVIVLMPNGTDPHEWDPSARDIEAVNRADLVVQNGLRLESGVQKVLQEAATGGVKVFTATNHISIRKVGVGEGIPTGDTDQDVGADDPHFWTDPVSLKNVVAALAIQLKSDLGVDVDTRSRYLQDRLDSLNAELSNVVSALPAGDRKLVTGHESMGYFAARYGFRLIGAVVPSLTPQAEVSASSLATLKKLIDDNRVKAIFTEVGTSPAVVAALARETGARVIELNTHSLPADGSYFTFERDLAKVIVEGLK
jgi:zinc/manganese transport system substrate-binding protein